MHRWQAASQPTISPSDKIVIKAGLPSAASPYSGPFNMLSVRPKTVCVQYGARSQWISVDRVKIFRGHAEEPVAQPAQRGRPKKQHKDALSS